MANVVTVVIVEILHWGCVVVIATQCVHGLYFECVYVHCVSAIANQESAECCDGSASNPEIDCHVSIVADTCDHRYAVHLCVVNQYDAFSVLTMKAAITAVSHDVAGDCCSNDDDYLQRDCAYSASWIVEACAAMQLVLLVEECVGKRLNTGYFYC